MVKRVWLFILLTAIIVTGVIPIFGNLFAPSVLAQMSVLQKTEANIVWVSPGSFHYAALDDEGRVWTWAVSTTYNDELGRAYSTSVSGTSYNNRTVATYQEAGQVTDTIYSGVTLPFILQISSSFRNTYALDRDGNIWSWGNNPGGASSYYALGRTGDANRPGKVVMPIDPVTGVAVKAKWIGAGYYGCKFIDTSGNLWVFGSGMGNSLGTGNTTNLNTPVRLETDENGNSLLGLNFKMVESSDYFDTACAVAITEDGKLYTWGRMAGAGYTTYPNDLRSAKPRYIGTYNTSTPIGGPNVVGYIANSNALGSEVKSLTCGNGSMGFLTYSGEAYTWGTNANVAGSGRLGHGHTNTVPLPTKITNVNNSTTPAPKFVSLSIYAWSSSAVDENGNVYGAGENNGSKHSNIGSPNYLTSYNPSFRTATWNPRIFIVSEGYYGTQWIDVYGNCYSRGSSNSSGGATATEPWVHFFGMGVPMFTKLDSNPSIENKRYTDFPRTTLSVELNMYTDQVKYVILYPDDAYRYSLDNELFYQKSFYEFMEPYYNAGTNPQLLLSPNYDKWESRYYANPKISQQIFDEIYAIKLAIGEAGTMDRVSANSFQKENLLDGNCMVWVQSANSAGTTRMVYQVANFYTPAIVWVQGILPGGNPDGSDKILYLPMLVDGIYGIPLTRDGSQVAYTNPPLGWDVVQPTPQLGWTGSNYYMLDPGTQLALDPIPDEFGVKHRTYVDGFGAREIILDSVLKMSTTPIDYQTSSTDYTVVTFTYKKDPAMWADAIIRFVYEDGSLVSGLSTMTHNLMVPITATPQGLLSILDPYIPPDSTDPTDAAVGYYIGTYINAGATPYNPCMFPSGFNPIAPNTNPIDIYIVYKKDLLSVTERYYQVNDGAATQTAITNNAGLPSIRNSFESDAVVTLSGTSINYNVLFGYEIYKETAPGSGVWTWVSTTHFNWLSPNPLLSGSYLLVDAKILDLDGTNWEIRWLYYPDRNGNGVPDEYEATVTIHWLGRNSDGTTATLNTVIVVDKDNTSKQFVEDKSIHLTDYDQWLLSPNTKYSTYSPVGSPSPTATITFDKDNAQHVYFWYNADLNVNGIPDEDEYLTIKYRVYGDATTPLQADVDVTFLLGNTYVLAPPTIAGYHPVGWCAGAYSASMTDTEIHLIEYLTDYLSVYFVTDVLPNGQVLTFIYKEIAEPIKVNFKAVTFAGTVIDMPSQILTGLVGQDVTSFLNDPLSGSPLWILSLPDSTLPSGGQYILTNSAQEYTLYYKENTAYLIVTVTLQSTDDKFNFEYLVKELNPTASFTITAPAIPNYMVTTWELYDDYGTGIDSGTGDTVSIDPSNGNQYLVFTYVCLDTEIYVKCIGPDGQLLYSEFLTGARIGDKYAVIAPHLDLWSLNDTLVKIVDPVVAGTNVVTFQYAAIADVSFELYETGATEPIVRVNITAAHNYTVTDVEAYLSMLYTFNQLVTTANGGPLLPLNIDATILASGVSVYKLYFDKILVPVVIRPVDGGGSPVAGDILTYFSNASNWLRSGEMAQVTTEAIAGYVLQEADTKLIYVDPTSTTASPQIVYFVYKSALMSSVTVLAYHGSSESNIIETYTVEVEVGSTFTATAGLHAGYSLVAGQVNPQTILVSANPGDNIIKFQYNDVRLTVTINTKIGGTVSNHATEKVPSGTSLTIWPPSKYGYVATSYSVNGGTETTIDSSFAGYVVTVTANTSITFTYKPIEEVVDEYVVTIVVRGVINGTDTVLYTYSTYKAKNSSPFTVNAFDVNGYKIVGANSATLSVGTTPITHTFYYESLATTVTIYATDGSGTPIPGFTPIVAPAVIGQSFSYNAPYILGWNLQVSESVTKNISVTAAGQSITFKYDKAVGNVTVILKDNDTGRVIKTLSMELTVSHTTSSPLIVGIPNLSSDGYTAVSTTPEELVYDGNSHTVEYYYTKNTRPVNIEVWDITGTPDLKATIPQGDYRVGEVSSFTAPVISGYKLVSTTPQLVLIEDASGTQTVIFNYTTLATDELVVEAVIQTGIDASSNPVYGLLYTYTIKGTVGQTISVTAPTLVGYKLVGTETTKSGTISGTITFIYEKNVANITVVIQDNGGANLLPSASYEVPIGLDHTVYAPHIAGYVLVSSGSMTFNNVSADQTATFVYKPVTEAITWRTLTFNANGGGVVPYPITVQNGTILYLIGMFATPPSGMVFTGWADAASGGSIITSVTMNSDVTVFAQYAPLSATYTVTINNSYAPVTGTGSYSPASLVTINAGVRAGFTFSGWTVTSGGVILSNPSSTTTTFTMPSSNVVIIANWTAISPTTYTVTVNNSYAVATDTGAGTYNVGNLVTINAGTRTGYTFSGWTVTSGGATLNNFSSAITTFYMPSNNVIVTANWVQVTYTVTYNSNGSTGGIVPLDSTLYTAGSTVTILGQNSLTRSSYTFLGWSTDSQATTAQYRAGDTFNIYSNTILYAVWQQSVPTITYIVSYNGNGHTGGAAPVDTASPYNAGSMVTVLGNVGGLVKNGYTFLGWSTNQASSSAQYKAGDVFQISSNTTLYAVWQKDTPVINQTTGTWSLANLVLCVLGALLAVALITYVFIFKREKRYTWLALTVIAGIIGIIVFFLTQDISKAVTAFDWWTIVNIILLVVGVIAAVLAIGTTNKRQT